MFQRHSSYFQLLNTSTFCKNLYLKKLKKEKQRHLTNSAERSTFELKYKYSIMYNLISKSVPLLLFAH